MRPLVADYIETLAPYVPGKPIEETEREYGLSNVIKLASNENALGPSPLAVRAMQDALATVNLYPDGSNFALVRRLATHLGVEPGEVFVGHGSNEIIELIIRAFTSPNDVALLCQGSFVMYKVALQSHGRRFIEVPMQDGFRYDLAAMARALTPQTRLVFLANPDNPTGTAFSRTELEQFLSAVGPETLVVLDEAYFEYVDWNEYPNGLDYFRKLPNFMIMRTFSKIYGLAGVRIGYAVGQRPLVQYLNRVRMPFNLSSVAHAGGIAALDDLEHVRSTRESTWRALKYFDTELPKLGVRVAKSRANFVFADLGRPAAPVYEALLRRGVITRPLRPSGWLEALRISCGLVSQNERLVKALGEVLRG